MTSGPEAPVLDEGGGRAAEVGGTGMFATLLQTLAVLGIVVALIYLVLNFGLRRLMGVASVGSASTVTVIERVSLDLKRSLFVVRAAGEYLLIGGGEGSLSLITKLDAAEVERLRPRPSATAATPFLQKLLQRRGPPPAG